LRLHQRLIVRAQHSPQIALANARGFALDDPDTFVSLFRIETGLDHGRELMRFEKPHRL
jgi:hypothetical protein